MKSGIFNDAKGIRALLLITFAFQLFFVQSCYGRINTTRRLGGHGGEVRLTTTPKNVVLDNGILQVTIGVPGGYVTAIQFNGIKNVLAESQDEDGRGYWDFASAVKLDDDDSSEVPIIGKSFKVIKHTAEHAEVSFLYPQSPRIPLQVDMRYVMLRGSSGFYAYAIFERAKGWGPLEIDQIRTAFKLNDDRFRYMAVSDKIQRVMPTLKDRNSGKPLAYKEAVLLTDPSNPQLKGEVDDKYQYACEDKDNKVHGWVSVDPNVGVWIITPSDEFRLGGPHKQDLTAHVGPTLLEMFHSTHFAGTDLSMKFIAGEPWKKVFGPYFVHLNSAPGKGDPQALWKMAKAQMEVEVKAWPYVFAESADYPKANQRGSVVGRLLVNDGLKAPVPAADAWIGLSPPGEAGSFQNQTKGYQFWVQTDKEGRFRITSIHPGNYNLFATIPGYIGDFRSTEHFGISPGKEHNVGDQIYVPPRMGPTLWEIGIPDRTAAEFFIPEPTKELANRQLLPSGEKYRQYGLWDRYTDLYPKEDLIFTVGKSDYKKDWFFAHVLRKEGNTYKSTTWQIQFNLPSVDPKGKYTLQIALASATQAELQVRINNPDLKANPLFRTMLIGRDNAIARHGIHGLYKLYSVQVPGSVLKSGSNTIFLTQSRDKDFNRGLMYDYIRFEGPSVNKA